MTIGQTMAGPIENIPNLKKRQRAVYWRKIGDTWVETKLLPSDATGRENYLSKGFRLKPPSNEPEPEKSSLDEIKLLRQQIKDLKSGKEKEEKSLSGRL